MEYPKGENFVDFLLKKHEKRLSESEARGYFIQILSLIEYLHNNNIVHRNLNLRNVFVDQEQLQVGDLLLCTKIKPIYKPHSDASAYHFYAPEIWLEEGHPIESGADIWALG